MGLMKLLPRSLVFAIHRQRYAAAAGPRVPSDDPRVLEALGTLDRDGVAVVPGFWDRARALRLGEVLDTAAAALDRDPNAVEAAFYGTKEAVRFYWEPSTRLIRVMTPEKLSAETGEFFQDAFVGAVAKAYTCENIVSWQKMYESRANRPVVGPADNWHVDEAFYFKFKAFLYLSDVSAETAPFTYLKGSHRPAPWRSAKMRRMLSHDIYGPASEYGIRGNHIDHRELQFLKKTHGYEELACVGPAGTLVLTDTNGLHRATTPVSGGRRMLGHYFELPRRGIWPPTFKNG